MLSTWEPPGSQGRVIGGLLGVLVGEGLHSSGGRASLGAVQPMTAAVIDVAHGYVARRGLTAPVEVAQRHQGVGGLGWLLPVAVVRPDAPGRISDTLDLAGPAGVSWEQFGSCVAYVELASRVLAGWPPHEAAAGIVTSSVAASDGVPALHGDAAVDGLNVTVWALNRPMPLTDVVVRLRQFVPREVAAAACGVLGLHHGADAVPQRWQQRLRHVADCLALTPALLRVRGAPALEPTPASDGERTSVVRLHGLGGSGQ